MLSAACSYWSVGATPVPIPNTVVKPYSADGTPFERTRESRPSPAPHWAAQIFGRPFLFVGKATEQAGGVSSNRCQLFSLRRPDFTRERPSASRHSNATEASPGVVSRQLISTLLTPPARSVAVNLERCPTQHKRASFRDAQSRDRHGRRETERRKIDAAQSHRRPEAEHHQPEAPVHSRPRRRDLYGRRLADGDPRHAGTSQSRLPAAASDARDGSARAG